MNLFGKENDHGGYSFLFNANVDVDMRIYRTNYSTVFHALMRLIRWSSGHGTTPLSTSATENGERKCHLPLEISQLLISMPPPLMSPTASTSHLIRNSKPRILSQRARAHVAGERWTSLSMQLASAFQPRPPNLRHLSPLKCPQTPQTRLPHKPAHHPLLKPNLTPDHHIAAISAVVPMSVPIT